MAENNKPVQKSSYFLIESNSHFHISEIYATTILPLCVRYKIGFQGQKKTRFPFTGSNAHFLWPY